MTQPDMQPEEAPRRNDGQREPAGGTARRSAEERCRYGNRGGGALPSGDWGEPAERLEELYRWVEARALTTAEWYLHDRRWRRRGARALRYGGLLGASLGVMLPVLDLADVLGDGASWGYVALGLGLLCVAADRYFGLTSGWMRDMATAQAVRRRLDTLQFDWTSESIREVLGPTEGTASEAAERCLGVLRRFCEDVSEVVREETAEWMLEFSGVLARPQCRGVAPSQAHPGEASPPGRSTPPSGSRPSMPRQRPPEPPR